MSDGERLIDVHMSVTASNGRVLFDARHPRMSIGTREPSVIILVPFMVEGVKCKARLEATLLEET